MAGKSRERGQIRKRGHQKYLIRVYLGRVNGKRKYASKTVLGTKKEADAELVKWLREMDTDTFVKPTNNRRLSEVLSEWLETKVDVQPGTLKGYELRIEKAIEPHLGYWKLSQLSEERLQRFFNELKDVYAHKTLQHVRTVLNMAFNMAIRRNYMVRNPLRGVRLPKKERSTTPYVTLTAEETNRLLETTSGDRYGALWGILLGTGMRPQEACALKWEDIDYQKGTVVIRRVLRDWGTRKNFRVEEIEGKTSHAFGTLKLPQSLFETLREHRQAQLREAMKTGMRNPEGWIFLTQRGAPPLLSNVQQYWNLACKKAKVSEVRLYDTRHTHATHLLEAGVHPKIVQGRLRHSKISTTMDTYSHLRDEMDETAADVFDTLRAAAGAVGVHA